MPIGRNEYDNHPVFGCLVYGPHTMTFNANEVTVLRQDVVYGEMVTVVINQAEEEPDCDTPQIVE
jgi:hypothetical protein